MSDLIKFLIFVIYSTCIFFFPNNEIILCFVIVNLVTMFIMRKHWKKILIGTLNLFPFVLFTFAINCLLDTCINAFWIGFKLIIVCNITMTYSKTTTVAGVANTIKLLCTPLKIFGVNLDEIKILVCISLSMISIFKNDVNDIKMACSAKNISINLKHIKIILTRFFLSIIKRINQIEESLISKGINF